MKKKIIFNSLFAIILLFFISNVQAVSIPQSYDLRKSNPGNLSAHGDISITVKDQGWFDANKYLTCWAHGALNSLETHIKVKRKENPTFSIRHLDYLASTQFDKGFTRKVAGTGGFNLALRYYMNNDGPVSNNKSNLTKYPIWSNTTGKVTNGANYAYQTLTTSQKTTIDGYKPEYYVHEVINFPTMVKKGGKTYYAKIFNEIAGATSSTNNNVQIEKNPLSDSEVKKNRDKIKQHIMENGGISCLIRSDTRFRYPKLNSYTRKGNKYVYDDGSVTNERGWHVVTIVGWDDNKDFSKYNFTNASGKTVRPKKKGAYLILNSYGSSYGAIKDNDGYQWVSYEDAYVESDLNGYLKVDKTKKEITAKFSNSDVYKEVKDKEINAIKNSSAYKDVKEKYYPITLTEKDKSIKMLDLVANTYPISELNLYGTMVTSNDIKEIKKLDIKNHIKQIDLSKNNLKDISALSNWTNLNKLTLAYNNIVDVSSLKECTKLKELDLEDNKIEDVSSIDSIIKGCTKVNFNYQNIEKTINNTKLCNYPNIILQAKNSSSKLYSSSGLEFTNCKENSDGKGITVTDINKNATVKVKSGNASGTLMTITVKGTIEEPEPEPEKIKKGDINKDGKINIQDVLALRRYISYTSNKTIQDKHKDWNLTEEQKKVADVDGKNGINIQDVLKLRRYISAQSNETIRMKHPEWNNL